MTLTFTVLGHLKRSTRVNFHLSEPFHDLRILEENENMERVHCGKRSHRCIDVTVRMETPAVCKLPGPIQAV